MPCQCGCVGRKLKTGIRAAPKVQEQELVRKGKELRERPEVLLPQCVEDYCPRCPFDALRERLLRVSQASEDEPALERLARRGHPLVKAYAATLLVGLQGKAPYLAPAKTPYGTVHYALRGKADREKLVGVQYFDVPELRLLTIGDMARKKRLHVYSLADRMVTTCREDRPPEEFVQESLRRTQVAFRRRDDEYLCPHAEEDPAVLLDWRGAGVKLGLCKRCGPPKENMPTFLGQRMIVPNLPDSFDLHLWPNLRCSHDECTFGGDHHLEGRDADSYFAGSMSEAQLIDKVLGDLVRQKAKAEGLFVVGNQCFEEDYDSFLQAMKVPVEILPAFQTLKDELEGGLVVKEASVSKLVDALDRSQKARLLGALLEDEEMGEAMMEASEAEGRSMDDVLAEALATRRDITALSTLPTWNSLPPLATLADGVARTYRTKGKEEAALVASRGLQGERSRKVLSLALLQGLEAASGKEWMFRKEERQLADFLTPTVKDLLTTQGEEYVETLQRLLIACGSGEKLPR